MNLEELTLDNICGGAVPERFHRAMQQIVKNMRDMNVPVKAKREIDMKFTFEPHADRCGGEVTVRVKQTLGGDEEVKGNIYMGQAQGGELKAYPRDIRQELLFAGENKTDRAV